MTSMDIVVAHSGKIDGVSIRANHIIPLSSPRPITLVDKFLILLPAWKTVSKLGCSPIVGIKIRRMRRFFRTFICGFPDSATGQSQIDPFNCRLHRSITVIATVVVVIVALRTGPQSGTQQHRGHKNQNWFFHKYRFLIVTSKSAIDSNILHLNVQSYINSVKQKEENNYHCSPLGDSCRIQTCNLLIRSQMLYSVELRSQYFVSRNRMQRYKVFQYMPNLFCEMRPNSPIHLIYRV